jgi:hypothetical protein
MSSVRKFSIFLLAFGFLMEADSESIVLQGSLMPTAEARIGRPATPVSVAGVGRRTVRRCAVGVYNC